MFTQLAHTATGTALEAKLWCAYSLPAAIAPIGANPASEAGLGRVRLFGGMPMISSSFAVGKDRPPGAFV